MKLRLIVVTLTVMALSALGGCTKSGPKLVKVAGTVKFKDGNLIPIPDKDKAPAPMINFKPVGEAAIGQLHKGAGGTIDANGHFELATFKPGDGVGPGKYQVTITAYSSNTRDPKSLLIPAKYLKTEESGIEFDIDKPRTDLVIELDKQ
jgi:hypothetical protein